MSFSFDGMSNFRDAFLHKTIALGVKYYTHNLKEALVIRKTTGDFVYFSQFLNYIFVGVDKLTQ